MYTPIFSTATITCSTCCAGSKMQQENLVEQSDTKVRYTFNICMIGCQKSKIVSVNFINIQDVQDDVDVTVQIDDPPSKFISVNLNIKDKLSSIRQKLIQNSKVKMNDTLSFANKINNNDDNTGGSSLADIAKEDEEKIILKNIIDKGSKTLYLKSEPDWKFFKDKLKLEYGRAETLEKANKRAFTIVGCEMNEVVDGYTIQIGLEEDKIIKNDFLLIADIDIPNFAKFGVSVGNSNIKNSNVVTNLTYRVIEYNKMSLKFKLEPTTEFIEAVKDVIDSKNPRNLYSTENNYGPIFLKQKISEIEVKYINVNSLNCDQNDCICKSKGIKGLENNLKYAFLDPKGSS
ncbi:hypothetical protein RhiirA4_514098 [Rhizophagus irregularis]|uniref:DUF7431 domain-containing protein n=1 Tax=Rhizophagus irregularis TaxID=588596 RepID=A0A2I1HJD9_9GLOM|nr:hypothetical protein RhiirA4_514098 [Rhizophagus irregularis]